MRLARAADVTIVVSQREDLVLDAHLIRGGFSMVQAVRDIGLASVPHPDAGFDAGELASLALVAWELDGNIYGRTISDSGSVGAVHALSRSEWPATNPRLTQLGGETFLLYERIDPDAGYVPRIFALRISEATRRRIVMRR